MKLLRNIRWGYTRDVIGLTNYAVELTVEEMNNDIFYVTLIQSQGCCMYNIGGKPLLDLLIFSSDDGDIDGKNYFEFAEDEDAGDWFEDSPFFNVLNLACHAICELEKRFSDAQYDGEFDGARAFAQQYLQKDIEKIDIPLFSADMWRK